jgi:hypothetical protein
MFYRRIIMCWKVRWLDGNSNMSRGILWSACLLPLDILWDTLLPGRSNCPTCWSAKSEYVEHSWSIGACKAQCRESLDSGATCASPFSHTRAIERKKQRKKRETFGLGQAIVVCDWQINSQLPRPFHQWFGKYRRQPSYHSPLLHSRVEGAKM